MPMLSIKWRQPALPAHVIVIVIIYVTIFRFLPREIILLVLGSLIAHPLAVEPDKPAQAPAILECGQ
jgi:membrane protein DedA with SNARE-associated domain